ncbi:kinase-like domain-containing protein [Scheffersomyces xylosifermentans]|uniref:kinase-like domain-containing protein n=1 Tax=Scheffersomyces xylosifermentans TaxID=1304137 RepID=UPI00315CDF1C
MTESELSVPPYEATTAYRDFRELKQWLVKSDCQQHYSKFVEHGITLDLLPELDTASLKELGINKLGDRLRLELAISSLKAERLASAVSVDELFRLVNLQLSQALPEAKTLYRVKDGNNPDGGLKPADSATLIPLNNDSSSSSNFAGSTSHQHKDSNKNITFILQDGTTKRVNVTGCFNAQSIKRKVLKRLGIKSQETDYDTYIHNTSTTNNGSNSNNGNNTSSDKEDPPVSVLFDVELVTICYSPDRLEKHRIILCPKNEYPTDIAIETSRRILLKYDRHYNSRLLSSENLSQYHIPDQRKDVHKRPTLRNFFGQRPPSELISSNLAEYFPDTRQKDLEATVRNSVRYSVRISRRFNLPQSLTSQSGGYGSSNVSVNRRLSMASNSTMVSPHRTPSLASAEQQVPVPRRHIHGRTIGDVMVNNITAIDEAVNSNDNQSIFSKPPSVYSNTSGPNDSRSFISVGSNGRSLHPQRHSIAASFVDLSGSSNNRNSRIELMSVESDSDESEDFFDVYAEEESFNGLDTISEDGPKNWLKGARIGAGSFGSVYLGMNPISGELMAVKQIPLPTKSANLEENKRLMSEQQRELTLLKSLNHENIVRYYGASTDESYLNIFLEYVPGGSVQSMLQSYGPFEEPLIRNFIRQVLIGLSYLHGEDIIHRDIKGANILIDIKGTVKIGDFGISKKVNNIEDDDTQDSKKAGRRASLQGSVYWMAPEVVKQTVYTKKADIWSVGCLIVEMFTGKHPFPEFSQMQAIFKIGTHITPVIPEWCTTEAKDFLKKTFEIDHENRPDAIDMLSESFLNPLIMSKQ